jgi:hypothetical protein
MVRWLVFILDAGGKRRRGHAETNGKTAVGHNI